MSSTTKDTAAHLPVTLYPCHVGLMSRASGICKTIQIAIFGDETSATGMEVSPVTQNWAITAILMSLQWATRSEQSIWRLD